MSYSSFVFQSLRRGFPFRQACRRHPDLLISQLCGGRLGEPLDQDQDGSGQGGPSPRGKTPHEVPFGGNSQTKRHIHLGIGK